MDPWVKPLTCLGQTERQLQAMGFWIWKGSKLEETQLCSKQTDSFYRSLGDRACVRPARTNGTWLHLPVLHFCGCHKTLPPTSQLWVLEVWHGPHWAESKMPKAVLLWRLWGESYPLALTQFPEFRVCSVSPLNPCLCPCSHHHIFSSNHSWEITHFRALWWPWVCLANPGNLPINHTSKVSAVKIMY